MRYMEEVPSSLDNKMRRHAISDARLAEVSGRHRTEIWNYRTGRRVPRADTAEAILRALRKLGVVMTLRELIDNEDHRRSG